MLRPINPALLRGALLGAIAVAAMLGGCGRKGPLELPPSAQAERPAGEEAAREQPPVMSRSGQPIAPPGEDKRIPLDWLID